MRRNGEKRTEPNIFLNAAIGGLTGLVSAMIMLLIVAVLTSMDKIPLIYMKEATMLCVGLGAMFASYSASSRQKGKALLTGAGTAAAMFLLILAISAFARSGALTGAMTPYVLLAVFIGGLLGAVLSARSAGRR